MVEFFTRLRFEDVHFYGGEGNVAPVLSEFIDATQIAPAATVFGKSLTGLKVTTGAGSTVQELASLETLMNKLLRAFVPDGCKADVRFPTEICANGQVVVAKNIDHIQMVSELFIQLRKLALAIGFIVTRFGFWPNEKDPIAGNNSLIKPDALQAMRTLQACKTQASAEWQAAAYDEAVTQLCTGLVPNLNVVSMWLCNVETARRDFCKASLMVLVSVGDKLAKAVEAATPRHEHIVSDTRFAKALAKKHIVDWDADEELEEKSLKLCEVLTQIKTLWMEFGVQPAFESDKELNESYDSMLSVYNAGVKSCAIISACRIVIDVPKGKDQREQANFMLTAPQAKKLPEMLLNAIKEAAGQ